MNPSPVCCEPCEVLRYCVQERNCCLECHFDYEEVLALPFLSAPLQARLLREHAWLKRNGFPEAAVAAHAAWEEPVFRKYCPPELCEIIERDHVAHGHGKLPSRVDQTRQVNMLSRVAPPPRLVNMPLGVVPPSRHVNMPIGVVPPSRHVNMPIGLVPPGRNSGMFSPRWATAAMR